MKLNEELTKMKSMMGLNENKQTYPYSCAMLYFNPDAVTELHNKINTGVNHTTIFTIQFLGDYNLII